MAARSTRLVGPGIIPGPVGTGSSIYTVPAGKTALVKSVRIVNQAGVSRTVVLGVGGVGIAAQLLNATIGAGATYVEDREAPFVLHEGEDLWCAVTAGQTPTNVTLTLSGALLDA